MVESVLIKFNHAHITFIMHATSNMKHKSENLLVSLKKNIWFRLVIYLNFYLPHKKDRSYSHELFFNATLNTLEKY